MEDFEGDVDRVAARVAWDYMQVGVLIACYIITVCCYMFEVQWQANACSCRYLVSVHTVPHILQRLVT
jgi:hypothetical protein